MERLCSSDIPTGNCRKLSFPAKRGMLLILRNLRTQFSSFKFNIVGKLYSINNRDVLVKLYKASTNPSQSLAYVCHSSNGMNTAISHGEQEQ